MLNYKSHQAGNAKIETAVILLHGYGSNGADLLSLAQMWAPSFPSTVFIGPDAPTPCEMGNDGFQWFSLAEYTPASMRAGAEKVYPEIEQFIQGIAEKYSLSEKKIVLCGFSQGTMMSLFTALRVPNMLSGVIGYSGALIDEPSNKPEYKDFPILLVHGEDDPVVPVHATIMATNSFKNAGFEVDENLIPSLQHGIDQKGLELGQDFIKKYLK